MLATMSYVGSRRAMYAALVDLSERVCLVLPTSLLMCSMTRRQLIHRRCTHTTNASTLSHSIPLSHASSSPHTLPCFPASHQLYSNKQQLPFSFFFFFNDPAPPKISPLPPPAPLPT